MLIWFYFLLHERIAICLSNHNLPPFFLSFHLQILSGFFENRNLIHQLHFRSVHHVLRQFGLFSFTWWRILEAILYGSFTLGLSLRDFQVKTYLIVFSDCEVWISISTLSINFELWKIELVFSHMTLLCWSASSKNLTERISSCLMGGSVFVFLLIDTLVVCWVEKRSHVPERIV